jgi:hypothetical protein
MKQGGCLGRRSNVNKENGHDHQTNRIRTPRTSSGPATATSIRSTRTAPPARSRCRSGTRSSTRSSPSTWTARPAQHGGEPRRERGRALLHLHAQRGHPLPRRHARSRRGRQVHHRPRLRPDTAEPDQDRLGADRDGRGVDDLTVRVDLASRFGAFIPFLADSFSSMVCDTNDPETFGSTTAIGTGPFKLVSWVKGDTVTLERTPTT